MSDAHHVRPGDHLSRVAATHQFRTYAPLWDEPANLELRKRRGTPHILAVDDPVVVPELNDREVDRATEQRYRFVAAVRPLVVRLALRRWDGRPTEAAPSEVLLDGKPTPFTAPAPGVIEVSVGPLTDRCTLKQGDAEVTARVGFLQPADTVAGWRERLNNLGYFAGDKDDPDDLAVRSAVEEFQCDHQLVVDGVVGPATRARLVQVHGC